MYIFLHPFSLVSLCSLVWMEIGFGIQSAADTCGSYVCYHIALMSASCWQRHQTSKSASKQTNKQQREGVLGQWSINIQVFQTAWMPQPRFISSHTHTSKCINLSGNHHSVFSYPSSTPCCYWSALPFSCCNIWLQNWEKQASLFFPPFFSTLSEAYVWPVPPNRGEIKPRRGDMAWQWISAGAR